MPHDKNGNELRIGDVVTMEFTIVNLYPTTDYCNVGLESVDNVFPGPHKTSLGAVNTKQVIKKTHE